MLLTLKAIGSLLSFIKVTFAINSLFPLLLSLLKISTSPGIIFSLNSKTIRINYFTFNFNGIIEINL